MRICIITIAFLSVSLLSKAQWVERYTYHDDEKQHLKEIFHVRDTISNQLEGPYFSYYLNGNIESKGQFTNNETTGVWEFYYETGKLKMRGALKNNSNYGTWEYFFENGNKQMEGIIINRKREGPWKIYYESGELKSEGSFDENEREGTWKTYFEDGNLKGEIAYTSDKGKYTEYYHSGEKKAEGPKSAMYNTGFWKHFSKDGNIKAEGNYENNKRVGEWTFYYSDGSISSVGNYIANEPVNEWTYYHKNGNVSSRGSYEEGDKSGVWSAYYPEGGIKSKTTYDEEKGVYKEYYPNGNIKVEGTLEEGKKHGLWKYYYEDGSLEGEADFDFGRGQYKGYYSDGTLQSKGLIENDQRKGTWELYDRTGSLKGYYNIFYDENNLDLSKLTKTEITRAKRQYGVADYGFNKRKFNYLKPKFNEFKGVILSVNPFTSFLGWVPLGIELYMEERLGYELLIEGVRDPFFTSNDDVNLNDVYTRGIELSLRQKFYNEDNGSFGLWYFGHSIGYGDLNHYVNRIEETSDELVTATAEEFKIIYSLLLGYRLMQATYTRGFTVDGYVGIGSGYRKLTIMPGEEESFSTLSKNEIPLEFTFGINFGYVFPTSRGR